MSTLLLNHVALNDVNSSQCISSYSTPANSDGLAGGLGGCLEGMGMNRDRPRRLEVGGAAETWPRADYAEADPYLMSYDASSAAVVAAARFMQGYRHHHHHHHNQQQQQATAMLPANSATSASSG